MSERRPVGFIDIDQTIYEKHGGYLLVPVLKGLAIRGMLNRDAAIHMNRLYHNTDPSEPHLDSDQRKLRFHEWCAKGVAGVLVVDAEEASYEIVQVEHEGFYPYVPELIAVTRPTHDLIIATAQPQFSASAVAKHLGINFVSTEYEEIEGRFTGRIKKSGITSAEKRNLIEPLLLAAGREGSFFVGDSAGDIGSMLLVDQVFCVNPDEAVRGEMEINRWIELNPQRIDSARVVLEALGRATIAPNFN